MILQEIFDEYQEVSMKNAAKVPTQANTKEQDKDESAGAISGVCRATELRGSPDFAGEGGEDLPPTE